MAPRAPTRGLHARTMRPVPGHGMRDAPSWKMAGDAPGVGPPGLRDHVARLVPGATIVAIEPLGPDAGATASSTTKAAGYGMPVRIVMTDRGERRELVWRVASANEFGHDRRADRAAAM